MFKIHYGTCTHPDCTHPDGALLVVKRGWCQFCNHREKQEKKKAAGKKTGPYKYKRKATGEASLFEDISAAREWKCAVTGEKLHKLTPTTFMHVLPKALNKFPLFKLEERNIILALDDIHYRWDHMPRSTLTEDFWKPLFELEAELKEEYAAMLKNNKLVINSHNI